MFSREESKRIREEFWIAFGKSFPRKWILYRTKIKGLSMKFHFDLNQASVSMEMEQNDLEQWFAVWDKLLALETVLREGYLKDVDFQEEHELPNGKTISRIVRSLGQVSIHNKNTWQKTMEFLFDSMNRMEAFFEEYKEVLEP